MKADTGNKDIAPHTFFNLGAWWRSVVSFMCQSSSENLGEAMYSVCPEMQEKLYVQYVCTCML
jgi:hypothetical protein